jgi:hypothetical protein
MSEPKDPSAKPPKPEPDTDAQAEAEADAALERRIRETQKALAEFFGRDGKPVTSAS